MSVELDPAALWGAIVAVVGGLASAVVALYRNGIRGRQEQNAALFEARTAQSQELAAQSQGLAAMQAAIERLETQGREVDQEHESIRVDIASLPERIRLIIGGQ
jgi:type II secretory pathway pseudopilin PulG